MFHGVEAQPLTPPCGYVLDAASLRRELEHVRRHFNVLPLEEALERLRDGTLPRRAATLTFDDGTRNLATHAAAVLRDLADHVTSGALRPVVDSVYPLADIALAHQAFERGGVMGKHVVTVSG